MAPSASRGTARRPAFRPNFLLVIGYLGALTIVFGLLIALPELLAATREAGAAPTPPSPEELRALGHDVTRRTVTGSRLLLAFVGAALAVGAGIWARVLPGFRDRH